MSVFGSFLEELEARSAIEDGLKRFARELYHDDAFDDHGVRRNPRARAAEVRRSSGHGMDDPLYKVRR